MQIFTEQYENALRDFAAKAAAAEIVHIIKSRNTSHMNVLEIKINRHEAFYEALLAMLLDITEMENPVYRQSNKLRSMAHGLRRTPLAARELQRLREFVAENSSLHIDGYITFRLSEFREKLDILIYSLVKKIKFGQKDL